MGCLLDIASLGSALCAWALTTSVLRLAYPLLPYPVNSMFNLV